MPGHPSLGVVPVVVVALGERAMPLPVVVVALSERAMPLPVVVVALSERAMPLPVVVVALGERAMPLPVVVGALSERAMPSSARASDGHMHTCVGEERCHQVRERVVATEASEGVHSERVFIGEREPAGR